MVVVAAVTVVVVTAMVIVVIMVVMVMALMVTMVVMLVALMVIMVVMIVALMIVVTVVLVAAGAGASGRGREVHHRTFGNRHKPGRDQQRVNESSDCFGTSLESPQVCRTSRDALQELP